MTIDEFGSHRDLIQAGNSDQGEVGHRKIKLPGWEGPLTDEQRAVYWKVPEAVRKIASAIVFAGDYDRRPIAKLLLTHERMEAVWRELQSSLRELGEGGLKARIEALEPREKLDHYGLSGADLSAESLILAGFYAVEATKPRTRDLHLAAVETDLAFRLGPAMRRPVLATPMARTARRLRIGLHHLAKRLKPSRQAKPLEARRDARQRFDLQLSRGNRSGCDKSVHGVAFLSWNQYPEPTGSRRATPLLLFQQ